MRATINHCGFKIEFSFSGDHEFEMHGVTVADAEQIESCFEFTPAPGQEWTSFQWECQFLPKDSGEAFRELHQIADECWDEWVRELDALEWSNCR